MATTHPPHDFAELKDRLAHEGEALPRRLKQVAAALLKNPDEIALSTAAQLAEKMDVQPSTLVRFAQVLGFRGFSELQLLFRNRLRESTVDHRARLKTLTQKGTAKLFDDFENMKVVQGLIFREITQIPKNRFISLAQRINSGDQSAYTEMERIADDIMDQLNKQDLDEILGSYDDVDDNDDGDDYPTPPTDDDDEDVDLSFLGDLGIEPPKK